MDESTDDKSKDGGDVQEAGRASFHRQRIGMINESGTETGGVGAERATERTITWGCGNLGTHLIYLTVPIEGAFIFKPFSICVDEKTRLNR